MKRLMSIWIISLLFSGCASVSETPRATVTQPTGYYPASVNYALSLQGVPYRYGKASPEEGFDCSGFVKHVYEHEGIKLPRTVQDMARALPVVPREERQSGDLLFFNTDGHSLSHVGIYVSGDEFIHAPSQHTGRVLISSLRNHYWEQRFMGVRRP